MKTIRENVFETNSSSMHSCTILTDSEYNDFKNGKIYFDRNIDDFLTVEGLTEEIKDCWKNKVDPKAFTVEIVEEVIKSMGNDFICYNDEDFDDDTKRKVARFLYENIDTYNTFGGDDYETYITTRTLPSGEVVHVLCYYRYS